MFKPLSFYIGLRYLKAQKKSHFVSFISLSSMIGIAIGVMVLITVLSVMNGFDEEIHKRFFSTAPAITITSNTGKIANWQSLAQRIKKDNPNIESLAPFVAIQGLMSYDGTVAPLLLMGILPEQEKGLSDLSNKMIFGKVEDLKSFGVLLSSQIARNLGLGAGDKMNIMIPQTTVTMAGVLPRFKRVHLAGVFSAGPGLNVDTKMGFMHMQDAQKLLQYQDEVTGFKIKIDHIYDAPVVAQHLATELGEGYQVGNWTEQFGAFFQAIKMEKNMMFLILLMIVAVATFNLVSSLVMVVNDKQSEIAILRTMGATPRTILSIFMIQGLLIGLIGIIMGLIGGVILASNATTIVNGLQNFFHTQLLSPNIYFLDYLPSKIEFSDLWKICILALLMSFIATLYPSWRASKTIIAEALHYE